MEAAGRIIAPRADSRRCEMESTTSSSSAPARAAAPSRGTWRRRASGSCCSSAATGCRASPRTGSRRTSSSTTATSREDTWYDSKGKPFQPQIHYFVGGATKLYGAALYRLRKEDFGELQPPRRPLACVADLLRRARALLHAGRAALRGARRARRGPDRAAGERAVSVPGGLARAADPAARRRPDGSRATTRSTPRAASG